MDGSSRLEFEIVYRENIRPVTAFFARRCRDPQHVADLTSQTFVEAIKSSNTFQGRGSPTAWLIAIARRVYANHLADEATGADLIDQLGGRLVLDQDEIDDLLERIDAQRDGKELLERAMLSDLEREAIDSSTFTGLAPRTPLACSASRRTCSVCGCSARTNDYERSKAMSAFDDGLWTRLVDEHAADRVALGSVPKGRSKRPMLVGASGVAAASVAALVIAVLSLTGGASNAFAGWSAQPTAPTAAQLDRREAYCAKNVPTPGLPLKLTDTRGPFTFMVYSDDSSNDFCTIGPVVPRTRRDGAPRRP